MHFLHMEAWGCLEEVPPFGIREPRPQYADGRPRVDVLEASCCAWRAWSLGWAGCGTAKAHARPRPQRIPALPTRLLAPTSTAAVGRAA